MARRKRGSAERPPHPDATDARSGTATADRLRPWLVAGVCALFVARPLIASESAAAEGDGLPIVMLWLVLAVVWLLGVLGRPDFRVRFGWIDAAVLGLFGLNVLAAVVGAVRGSPRPAVNMLWEWIGLGLGYFLARQFLAAAREIRAAAAVMIALATGLAGMGLYQYFVELPATRAAYARDPDATLRDADLEYLADPQQRRAFEDRLNSPEPMATFALTNSLAGFLAPWLVLTAGIGVLWMRQEVRVRAGLILAAVLVAGCLILTMSRSAYLATALGFALVGIWAGRRLWHHARLLAAAGLVLLALVGVAVATRGVDASVFSQAAKSLGYRLHYWQATTRLIADHPWLGVGPGNFQAEYTRYKLPQAVEEVAEPHNFLLEIGATAGMPAALVLLLALGAYAWRLLRAPRPSGDSTEPPSPAYRPGASTWALVGGACGFPLAMVLGLLASVSSAILGLSIALSLAVIILILLRRWVDDGWLAPRLLGVAVVVLLVNLLAAGGIGFPGVSGTLWLLMALGLNAAECGTGSETSDTSDVWRLTRRSALGLFAVGFLLLVACYATAYNPVLECRAWLRAAKRDPQARASCWQRAARADQLDARPWGLLAGDAFARWQAQGDQAAQALFHDYTEAALARSPNESAAWFIAGERYMAIYRATNLPEHLERSLAAYRQAVERYPHNMEYQAALALALRLGGDEVGFREHAKEAFRLEEVSGRGGHPRLNELRKELPRNVSRKM
ncbi:MAG: O-antigen ligase family protein [Thermoguttaceae bacterium]|jgi:O-antigen ligase|nr:O-antigen ligase family protein [Thermoguttaceae bacterium]